jgi:hypothetical protein
VKTKIVYCKDALRQGDFPVIAFDFLGYQFRARKTMWRKGERRIFTYRVQPAASPKALNRISRTVRCWALHHRSDLSLTELVAMHNPCIRGWIGYYGHFYKEQLRSVGTPQVQADAPSAQRGPRLVRPATPGEPSSLRPLGAVPWQRPNIGSRVNREVHARLL